MIFFQINEYANHEEVSRFNKNFAARCIEILDGKAPGIHMEKVLSYDGRSINPVYSTSVVKEEPLPEANGSVWVRIIAS